MYAAMDDDDELFVAPAGGSSLAAVFEKDQAAAGTGNAVFQYMPPKQPKKGQPATTAGPPTQKPPVPPVAAASSAAAPAPTAAAQSVFFATAVHAYLFTNGKYEKHGNYGAAVVGSHVTKEYRIILYISTLQQIATARIHAGFVFTVQPNNYCTFYDDQRQNWSIMFQSATAAVEFSKQLCVAKYNSCPSESVLYQDLVLGEGQGVEAGDALEITFTGWLFHNNRLGQVFDSNINKDKLLRLKLGAGKVIKGWEDGMIGLKKGGRRFLLVPPALAYGPAGEADHIPPNSTLAFEVEVKRVKFARNTGTAAQSLGPRDSLTPSPATQSEIPATDPACLSLAVRAPKPGEPAVRAKSSSISEQLANPDVAKVKLISRMAKMGQPTLPVPSSAFSSPQDPVDKEIEELNASLEFLTCPASDNRPVLPPPPQWATQAPHPAVSRLEAPAAPQPHPPLTRTTQYCQPYAGMPYAYPQVSAAASQLLPIGLCPAPFQAAGDIGSFLLTETRQQNTEVRLAIGKIADRLDQLSVKLEELQKQNTGPCLLPGLPSVTMEASMIMTNIQRIMQENESLKQEIMEKSSRIQEQSRKIGELVDDKQRCVEQSNLSEQSNTSLQITMAQTQARVLQVEQEKVRVTKELSEATARISQLQLEATAHQKQEMDLRSQLNEALAEAERHRAQLNQLHAQLAELQELSDDLKSKYQEEKRSQNQLNEKVEALEEELSVLRVKNKNLEKLCALQTRRSEEPVDDKVKRIMNEVFQALRTQFSLEEDYTGRQVLGVVLNTIKIITLRLLEIQEPKGSSSTKEEGPREGEQPSAEPLHGDPQSETLLKPGPVPFSSPASNLDESSNSLFATPLALFAVSEEEPSPPGEMHKTDITILTPLTSVVEEQAPAVEEPTMGPEDEQEDVPSQHIAGPASPSAPADKHQDVAGVPSTTQADSSLIEDKDDFSPFSTSKPSALGTRLSEGDDEEELSMKGRPPPTPLFDDDDDDDDPYLFD